jgi:hypothetical protein
MLYFMRGLLEAVCQLGTCEKTRSSIPIPFRYERTRLRVGLIAEGLDAEYGRRWTCR